MGDITSENELRYSVGQVSEMFNISSRTLRLYHENGLLVPQYVDSRTGYRYYASTQLPRLEMILQMKHVGLSLKRIEEILESKDLSVFEALLNEQIDELDEKILQYSASRKSLMNQLQSCKQMRNPPTLNNIFIEFISKRRALIFNIDGYDFRRDDYEESPWKKALSTIKDTMAEKNIPMELFRQVGCIIEKENLEKDQLICSRAFILLDAESRVNPCKILNSGLYVCAYRKYVSMDSISESEGIDMLLEYIRANRYTITGPYMGEVVAESSIFNYDSKNVLVKLQIPIKLAKG